MKFNVNHSIEDEPSIDFDQPPQQKEGEPLVSYIAKNILSPALSQKSNSVKLSDLDLLCFHRAG